MTTTNNRQKTQKMTQIGFLIALIVVLQTISALLGRLGLFSISLTLVPIVIGGFMMGPAVGALLGGVFGVMTFVFSVLNWDTGGNMLFLDNPFLCFTICILKAVLAGWLTALLYSFVHKKIDYEKRPKRWTVSVAAIAGLCPLINTIIFCTGMFFLFNDILNKWALSAGINIIAYIFLGLIGVNFIIEFCINVVLCPLLVRNLRKSRHFRDQF